LSRLAAAIAAALTLGLAASGCDKEEPNPTVAEPLATPGDGGSLGWAISRPVITLDPLAARTYPDEMIAAQVYEPLTSEIRGPESTGGGRMDGLATLESRRDGRVWRIELRTGVKFHDNSSLDAEAVVANFERWLLLQPGRRLLPPVRDVKAVSVTEVRVRLRRPDTGFAETLSSPRLGLVSPRAFSVETPED